MPSRVVLGGPTQETWGESVRRHVLREDHLVNLVRRIEERVAPIGTANTFKKLFDFEEVPAKKRDRFRAYCLLVSCGLDPTAFGLTVDDGPEANALYRQLKGIPRWYSGNPAPANPENADSHPAVTHRRIAA